MSTPAPTRPPRPAVPGVVPATLMVAEREILAQVRTKSFLISTAVLLLGVLAAVIGSSFLSGRTAEATQVAVVAQTADVVEAMPGMEPVMADDADAARELVESEEVAAAVLPDESGENPTGITVVALTDAPQSLVGGLSVAPSVELLDADEGDQTGLRYLVSFAFGAIFMMSAMTFGSTIAQNTVQEKQSRVVEILLSTVPARALLAGKILGNSALALGQTAAIAAVAIIGAVVTGQDELLSALGGPVAWFIVFFLVGFVLLASVFAASASLVSRIEDTGPVLTPVMMLTMTPYFVIVFFNENALVMKIASYVPFSAPVAMPVRLFLGEAAWWEPLAALALLVASCVAVIALGARIYARSLLRFSGRVRLKEALAA
ncbi:ABC transporter permease [Actinotalea sp. JY-7885]|uniref:ABC transporter permease n=1 Tax=Actinotalea sp. JY-7885 TaxID=2758576 RepID=UPI00165DF155|nr:ABC transporter permease [Actinotalea sp. JY-7885]